MLVFSVASISDQFVQNTLTSDIYLGFAAISAKFHENFQNFFEGILDKIKKYRLSAFPAGLELCSLERAQKC